MKLTSTAKFLSFLMISLFTLSSCLDSGKDDKNDDPTPDPDPVPEVSCALTKITYSYREGEQRFTYNDKGYISAVTTVNADGSSSASTYIYDGNNRVIKSESKTTEGVLQGYTTYTYTNDLLSNAESFDANNQLKSYTTFTRDAKGNVTELTRYTGSTVDKSTMTYTTDGNITKASHYKNGNLQTVMNYENYDNKKYYYTGLKGLPLTGVSANKNNYRKLTALYYNTNGELVETREFFYEYTYNEQGYPVQEVETYRDDQYTFYFTYECK